LFDDVSVQIPLINLDICVEKTEQSHDAKNLIFLERMLFSIVGLLNITKIRCPKIMR